MAAKNKEHLIGTLWINQLICKSTFFSKANGGAHHHKEIKGNGGWIDGDYK
ncbi:hypothetical protein M3610_24540 [Neobacillus sp. MER 74]|uniref:hypothetical protein n=1 Tax=Neobacillus sp. MER 74 TaxID=2939566 RepID=UPI00203B9645|nr:hypothetical protein [Neobacillus sp. MER 74]MCM3118383.1 hypothetical protein [Neobacillus sp. MER 74]